jgi:cytochrome c556
MLVRAVLIAAGIVVSASTLADEGENPAIEYRQSLMTLIGANFGPMAATVDGEVPWDDARMAGWGKDLEAVSGLNAMRGFPAGSEGGHAKPEIWSNLEDFRKKMQTMQLEIAKMGDAAIGGDREAIKAQVAATGKSCKACHDDYKKKDE